MSFDAKITVIAPSSIGKTTLISSILNEIDQIFHSVGLELPCADPRQEPFIQALKDSLNQTIHHQSLSFKRENVMGTEKGFIYQFHMNRDKELISKIGFMDFPGGWLNGEKEVNPSLKSWLLESNVMIIPVDATLIMESSYHPKYIEAAKNLLGIADIQKQIIEWVINQQEASLIFVPLKCENYFNDNTGIHDHSNDLYDRFYDFFGPMLHQISEYQKNISTFYIPVDTLGCVDLVDVEWTLNQKQQYMPKAHYRVRMNSPIQRKGIQDLIKILFKSMLNHLKYDISHSKTMLLKEIEETNMINKILVTQRINKLEKDENALLGIIDVVSKLKAEGRMRELL